jgi:glycosyltransferase involved in cell wall biosynthesis
VVVEHATQLRRHHDVDAHLVLTRPQEHPNWGYRGLGELPLLSLDEAATQRWDIAVASWWETALHLFALDARRHAYFVQLLEDSTYPFGAPERVTAAMTTALPVRFITEARWLADMLEDFQPGGRVLYVRNGIAKDVFRSPAAVTPAPGDAPLRIVIEGARDYVQKGVGDALRAVSLMRETAHVTWVSPHRVVAPPTGVDRVLSGLRHREIAELFARSHVMVKLSRAEGMYGPPLEAFHMGATVVTTAVTGHDEYVRHGENGLVVGWDDVHGTARALDLLTRDRRLLHELRSGALRTAQAWPDWRQSSQWMALALRRVLAEPMPPVRGAGIRLTSDFVSSLSDAQHADRRIEAEQADKVDLFGQKAWIYAVKARGYVERVRRPLRRIKRLLRR